MLLFRSVSGSHLYGTNHAGSDLDIYEVHDHCKPYHRVGEQYDITRWPLSMFLKIADKGGHNSLDLMFAPSGWPDVDFLDTFRASYYADPWKCLPRFLATIETFTEKGTEKGDRHAQRMSENLEELMYTGRYNPRWKKSGLDGRPDISHLFER